MHDEPDLNIRKSAGLFNSKPQMVKILLLKNLYTDVQMQQITEI